MAHQNEQEKAPASEKKPRTAAQKWARIEKIREKIKEFQDEEARLTEELKSTLA